MANDKFETRERAQKIGRRAVLAGGGVGLAALMAGCSNFSFGPSNITTRNIAQTPAVSQTAGTGSVKVALILPLTGDVASVGTSMANGAQLAMEYIQNNAQIADNITLLVKDSQGDAAMAARQASAAVAEGASLILGPLKADAVRQLRDR